MRTWLTFRFSFLSFAEWNFLSDTSNLCASFDSLWWIFLHSLSLIWRKGKCAENVYISTFQWFKWKVSAATLLVVVGCCWDLKDVRNLRLRSSHIRWGISRWGEEGEKDVWRRRGRSWMMMTWKMWEERKGEWRRNFTVEQFILTLLARREK